MRVKILFISLLMFISVNAFSATTFELNLGIGVDIPVSIISNFYNTAVDLGDKLKNDIGSVEREQIVQDFSDMVNVAKTGLNYGGHAQMGARFDDLFSLGFELGFDLSVFQAINRSGQLNDSVSFIGSLEPRFYTRLDFFIGAVALFTGPRLNMATGVKNSILDEFGVFSWDLGGRVVFSFLMLEAFYSWNIKNNVFSDLKVGLGFEFGVI
ncbi:hypothetical protein DB313_02840 [Borrelia turcica IST7]|uniref:Outer membrane protein beta-barrel domain-containing protein n=1 Tax=Borrelia turcica IST7 TaxID=1104446 RepID=A0A386PL48_9SPIR|nr:hypothetical protein [Borrelia turcica]AYE36406.1 hypothetical protein DB313_02840 [Borrelia turcica IST7]